MDTLNPNQRSARMRRVKSVDTTPELIIRKLIHSMGFRYRLHGKSLPGRPDLVFSSRRKVIFVHGCFWHQHSDPQCKLSRLPKSKLDFWLPKLHGNIKRDELVQVKLRELGWSVLIIWECKIRNVEQLKDQICEFLNEGC